MGTARMGDDPAHERVRTGGSALHDVEKRAVHGLVGVPPRPTGYGPTLTIVALAMRASRALAGL